jgi:hypothetical protein
VTLLSNTFFVKIASKLLATANAKSLLITTVLFLLSFFSFSLISAEFAKVTQGYIPLDLQFPLTVDRIFEQLPTYNSDSKRWYQIFGFMDFIFPPLASLFVMMLWGVIIKYFSSPFLLSMSKRGWLLLPMMSALLDWLENIGLLYVVHVFPQVEAYDVAEMAVNLRLLKLASLAMLAGLTLVIFIISMNHKYAWVRIRAR